MEADSEYSEVLTEMLNYQNNRMGLRVFANCVRIGKTSRFVVDLCREDRIS